MDNKHVKNRSASLVIRETRMTAAVRYQHALLGMTELKMASRSNGADVEQTDCHAFLVEPQNGAATLEKILCVRVLSLNIHLPLTPPILLPGIYPEDMKIFVHKKTCTQMFIVVLFIITPNLKLSVCSMGLPWWLRQ